MKTLQHRHADQIRRAQRKCRRRQRAAVEAAAQIFAQMRVAGSVVERVRGDEQHGLRRRVRQRMPQRAENAQLVAQAQRREDVANLRDGGIRHHHACRLGAHGVDRTGDHTDRAEDEQHVADAQRTDHVKADDAYIYLDQQEDIALGNDAGEHRGSARRAVGIGGGQPLVKREQRALHRKAHADEADHHRQRHVILAARRPARRRSRGC